MAEKIKGLVQVYTGDGKGKTTAALGLALRAAGRGRNVLFVQFLKEGKRGSGEALALRRAELPIILKRYGKDLLGKTSAGEKKKARERARQGLWYTARALKNRDADLIVLDEISHVMNLGLIEEEEVVALIDAKSRATELVLTGRDMPAEIVKRADLVTDMKNIKHPYDSGVTARYGIEY
jgi:cob(I)alamin adenosyltransferase